MANTLRKEYLEMESVVKDILKNNESLISYTVDGWSAKNLNSFYGITASFIDAEWFLISFAIDLVKSDGHHTGKHN